MSIITVAPKPLEKPHNFDTLSYISIFQSIIIMYRVRQRNVLFLGNCCSVSRDGSGGEVVL